MCIGCACLAILSQLAFPEAQVTGADISADALEVAKINRSKYGLDDTLELVQTDIFSQLGKRKFDLFISNPPYVTPPAKEELPAEYRHAPAQALDAGADDYLTKPFSVEELLARLRVVRPGRTGVPLPTARLRRTAPTRPRF